MYVRASQFVLCISPSSAIALEFAILVSRVHGSCSLLDANAGKAAIDILCSMIDHFPLLRRAEIDVGTVVYFAQTNPSGNALKRHGQTTGRAQKKLHGSEMRDSGEQR